MFTEFLDLARQRRENYPQERLGQAYMNALWFYDPEIHAVIHGSVADCFYDDKKLPEMLAETYIAIMYRDAAQYDNHEEWPPVARAVWPDGEQA